jgi:hypothetical protein
MSSLANINSELAPLAKNIEPVVKMLESMTKSTMKTHKAMGHLINNNKKMLQALEKGVVAQKANNKAVSDGTEETKKSTAELYSLVKAQETVNATTESFSRKFAKAANNVDGYGKKWTMFSRILSGSPLWKLQNYVRAVGQVMDGFQSRTEEATKAANEQALAMGELTNNIEQVEKQLKLMGEANNHKKLIESNLEYKNTFEALKAATEDARDTEEQALKKIEKAKQLALARTLNAYEATHEQLKENLKSEGKALQKALEREERLRNKSFLRKTKFTNEDLTRYETAIQKKIKADKKLEKIKKEMGKLTTTYSEDELKKGIDSKTGKAITGPMAKLIEKRQKAERGQRIASSRVRRLGDKGIDFPSMGQLRAALQQRADDAKKHHEMRIKVLKFIGKGTERFMTFGLGFENIAKGFKFLKEDSVRGKDGKRFEGIRTQLKEGHAYVKKQGGYRAVLRKKITPIFSIIGKVMKMAMLYSMYFIMFLVGALLAFVVIKKIFEKAQVMETLMDALRGVFDGIKDMFGGAILIFEAFFGGGTLKERFTKLFQGILGLYKGLYKILWSVLKGAVKLVIRLAIAYVAFVIKTYVTVIMAVIAGLRKIFTVKFWTETVAGGITALAKYVQNDFFPMLVTKGGEFIDKIINFITGEFGKLKDAINPFHMGGISKGGMSMVGERGPELINLPRGTRIHSNDTTKSMMGGSVTNNISVNVNGRLGASDSELRDIAKKIGRMVSTEINRTTSSSTNVRF